VFSHTKLRLKGNYSENQILPPPACPSDLSLEARGAKWEASQAKEGTPPACPAYRQAGGRQVAFT